MTRLTASDRRMLGAARSIIRGGSPTRPSATTIYEWVLLAGVIAVLVVRPAMLALALPGVTAALAALPLVTLTPPLLLSLGVGALTLGRVRGPVVPTEPHLALLAASPLPRRLTLRRPWWHSRLLVVGGGMLVGVVIVGAELIRASGAGTSALAIAGFLLGAALVSWQLTGLWLLGQTRTRLRSRITVTIWGLLAASLLALPLPALPEIPPLLMLLLLTAGALAAAPIGHLLDALDHDEMLDQARRWSAVANLVGTGDLRSAASRLRELPRRGRHWRTPRPGHPVTAVILRDLVGLRRFPARTVLSLATALGAGALLAALPLASATDAALRLVLLPIAPLLLYAAVGGCATGLRLHAAMIGASRPFGLAPGMQALAHLVTPTLLVLGVAVGGAAAAGALLSTTAVLTTSVLTLFAATVQAFASAKGDLPIALLTPMPSAAGDGSVVAVALWLADAVIIVALVGGGALAWLGSAEHPEVPLLALGAAGALMAWRAHARYRQLEQPAG